MFIEVTRASSESMFVSNERRVAAMLHESSSFSATVWKKNSMEKHIVSVGVLNVDTETGAHEDVF